MIYKIAFLDRDGVLNKAIIIKKKPYSPRLISQIVVSNELKKILSVAKNEYFLIGITNQPDVGDKIISRQKGIKINILGEIDKLPPDIKKTLRSTIEKTKNNKKILVNLAINYGSKKEITNAAKKNDKKMNKNTKK